MVIDSGYAKVSSFDPVRKINTLLSEKFVVVQPTSEVGGQEELQRDIVYAYGQSLTI